MNLFKAFSSKSPEPERAHEPEATPVAAVPPAPEAAPAPPKPRPPLSHAMQSVHDAVVSALKTCYDPEIPVNIYELGLIYDVEVNQLDSDPLGEATADVVVQMTLTSPMCPAAGSLPGDVKFKASQVPHVSSVRVDLVWEPAWNPNKMSEAAKLQLGML
jgi:FeS assembly SUF system protein